MAASESTGVWEFTKTEGTEYGRVPVLFISEAEQCGDCMEELKNIKKQVDVLWATDATNLTVRKC